LNDDLDLRFKRELVSALLDIKDQLKQLNGTIARCMIEHNNRR
jgi:hypothetical protein